MAIDVDNVLDVTEGIFNRLCDEEPAASDLLGPELSALRRAAEDLVANDWRLLARAHGILFAAREIAGLRDSSLEDPTRDAQKTVLSRLKMKGVAARPAPSDIVDQLTDRYPNLPAELLAYAATDTTALDGSQTRIHIKTFGRCNSRRIAERLTRDGPALIRWPGMVHEEDPDRALESPQCFVLVAPLAEQLVFRFRAATARLTSNHPLNGLRLGLEELIEAEHPQVDELFGSLTDAVVGILEQAVPLWEVVNQGAPPPELLTMGKLLAHYRRLCDRRAHDWERIDELAASLRERVHAELPRCTELATTCAKAAAARHPERTVRAAGSIAVEAYVRADHKRRADADHRAEQGILDDARELLAAFGPGKEGAEFVDRNNVRRFTRELAHEPTCWTRRRYDRVGRFELTEFGRPGVRFRDRFVIWPRVGVSLGTLQPIHHLIKRTLPGLVPEDFRVEILRRSLEEPDLPRAIPDLLAQIVEHLDASKDLSAVNERLEPFGVEVYSFRIGQVLPAGPDGRPQMFGTVDGRTYRVADCYRDASQPAGCVAKVLRLGLRRRGAGLDPVCPPRPVVVEMSAGATSREPFLDALGDVPAGCEDLAGKLIEAYPGQLELMQRDTRAQVARLAIDLVSRVQDPGHQIVRRGIEFLTRLGCTRFPTAQALTVGDLDAPEDYDLRYEFSGSDRFREVTVDLPGWRLGGETLRRATARVGAGSRPLDDQLRDAILHALAVGVTATDEERDRAIRRHLDGMGTNTRLPRSLGDLREPSAVEIDTRFADQLVELGEAIDGLRGDAASRAWRALDEFLGEHDLRLVPPLEESVDDLDPDLAEVKAGTFDATIPRGHPLRIERRALVAHRPDGTQRLSRRPARVVYSLGRHPETLRALHTLADQERGLGREAAFELEDAVLAAARSGQSGASAIAKHAGALLTQTASLPEADREALLDAMARDGVDVLPRCMDANIGDCHDDWFAIEFIDTEARAPGTLLDVLAPAVVHDSHAYATGHVRVAVRSDPTPSIWLEELGGTYGSVLEPARRAAATIRELAELEARAGVRNSAWPPDRYENRVAETLMEALRAARDSVPGDALLDSALCRGLHERFGVRFRPASSHPTAAEIERIAGPEDRFARVFSDRAPDEVTVERLGWSADGGTMGFEVSISAGRRPDWLKIATLVLEDQELWHGLEPLGPLAATARSSLETRLVALGPSDDLAACRLEVEQRLATLLGEYCRQEASDPGVRANLQDRLEQLGAFVYPKPNQHYCPTVIPAENTNVVYSKGTSDEDLVIFASGIHCPGVRSHEQVQLLTPEVTVTRTAPNEEVMQLKAIVRDNATLLGDSEGFAARIKSLELMSTDQLRDPGGQRQVQALLDRLSHALSPREELICAASGERLVADYCLDRLFTSMGLATPAYIHADGSLAPGGIRIAREVLSALHFAAALAVREGLGPKIAARVQTFRPEVEDILGDLASGSGDQFDVAERCVEATTTLFGVRAQVLLQPDGNAATDQATTRILHRTALAIDECERILAEEFRVSRDPIALAEAESGHSNRIHAGGVERVPVASLPPDGYSAEGTLVKEPCYVDLGRDRIIQKARLTIAGGG